MSRPCREAAAESQAFNSEGIADTLWALATLKEPQPELVSKLCWDAAVECQDFDSEVIAQTLWALATLKERQLELVSRLSREAVSRLGLRFLIY